MSTEPLPLIVVGAGPAGIAAAVEARRSGATVVLLDPTGVAGGGIRVAHEVRNVPFLPDRVSGAQVASSLRAFAERWGLEVTPQRCVRIERDDSGVLVSTWEGGQLKGCGVVVATGTRPLLPRISGLPEMFERPWAQSAPDACSDGPIGSAAVLGASDVAFDQARWLRAHGVAVTVLCRAASPKAPAWLVEAALGEGVALRTGARALSGCCVPARVILRVEANGMRDELKVDRVVAAVGRAPTWRESIAVDAEATSSVRIAGDAAGRRARHVVAALGDGCTAAADLLAVAMEGRG